MKLQLTGIGLRTPHLSYFLTQKSMIPWVEVHSENYFCDGGKSLQTLLSIKNECPVSLHGAGLSLGSTDEINWSHLKKLRDLCHIIEPCLVSEHLCWSSLNGEHLHDLLPLPYNEETLAHLVSRVESVQEYLQRQILIENIASYVSFKNNSMTEWEFIKQISEKSGCGILLDINSIYVNSVNLYFDAETYIKNIPAHLVQEIHLAGYSKEIINGREILLDTHNQCIHPPVWALYKKAIEILGSKPTIIEWDADLPPFEMLLQEAMLAEKIMREVYAAKRIAI